MIYQSTGIKSNLGNIFQGIFFKFYSLFAVNNSLPVHLTASNVQQNPEFAKFLTSLTRHLTESGISVTVHKDMVQVSVADIS